jgi:hypothetical protein
MHCATKLALKSANSGIIALVLVRMSGASYLKNFEQSHLNPTGENQIGLIPSV